eukprot:3185546-Alexandrium_andersonii.AAC.1
MSQVLAKADLPPPLPPLQEPTPPRQIPGGPIRGHTAPGRVALYHGGTHGSTFSLQGQEKGRPHWDD